MSDYYISSNHTFTRQKLEVKTFEQAKTIFNQYKERMKPSPDSEEPNWVKLIEEDQEHGTYMVLEHDIQNPQTGEFEPAPHSYRVWSKGLPVPRVLGVEHQGFPGHLTLYTRYCKQNNLQEVWN